MADYDDFINESKLDWDAGGIVITRNIYIRADTELDALVHADCPQRDDALVIVPAVVTPPSPAQYIYCSGVSIQAVKEAGGDNSEDFLWKVTATYKPLSSTNPTINKARWEVGFRPNQFTVLNVADASLQAHYGPDDLTAAGFTPITTGINVTEEGPQGVQVDEMVEVLTLEFWKHPNDVEDYLDGVRAILGTINDDSFTGPWGTYAAGEARITGMSVRNVQDEMSSITIEISVSRNQTDIENYLDSLAGETTDTVTYDKDGWDYAWVRYVKSSTPGDTNVRPLSVDVHVAKVYAEGDYTALGVTSGIFQ